jgi:undecaprenyl diphosphate synthase
LLWEAAYAEFFFSPKFWPDWTEADLREALAHFGVRERRYGGEGTSRQIIDKK